MSSKKKSQMVSLSSLSATAATNNVTFANAVQRSESFTDRITRWYIEPLKKMDNDQGFLVLMVLFPLYEVHLRVNEGQGDKPFSKGSPIFNTIGRHLQLSAENAFKFWQCFRNGLLHRAIPNESEDFKYLLRKNGQPILIVNDMFWINPFALRDRLLDEIVPNIRKWKASDVRLPETLDPM